MKPILSVSLVALPVALLASVGILVFSNRGVADERKPALADQPAKVFEWFSALDFPDVKHAPFVQFPCSVSFDRRQNPQVVFGNGFVIGENKVSWNILTCRLMLRTVEKKPWTPLIGSTAWNVQSIDFAQFADAALRSYRSGEVHFSSCEGFDLSETTTLVILAWACSRRGLDKQAVQLFDRASHAMGNNEHHADQLRRHVAIELARQDFESALVELRLGTGRDKVLSDLKTLAKRYPGIDVTFKATEMIAIFKKMVNEDDEHEKRAKQSELNAHRSRQEQIAELIFQLRNQRADGPGSKQDDEIHLFSTSPVTNDNPAGLLAIIGDDAVPQLIQTLMDDRLSRVIDFRLSGNDNGERPHVLTVGDCAKLISEEIAGRSFLQERRHHYSSESPSRMAAVKKEVEAWYAQQQRDHQKSKIGR